MTQLTNSEYRALAQALQVPDAPDVQVGGTLSDICYLCGQRLVWTELVWHTTTVCGYHWWLRCTCEDPDPCNDRWEP